MLVISKSLSAVPIKFMVFKKSVSLQTMKEFKSLH